MTKPPKLFVIDNRYHGTLSKKNLRYELQTRVLHNLGTRSTPDASLLRVTENERNIRNENQEMNPAGAAES